MKTPVMLAAIVLAVLALTTAASALELYTPPMFAGADHRIECAIANVTAMSRTVRIRIINGDDGSTLEDSGSFALSAGSLDSQDTAPAPGFAYCHFTVTGVMSNVRASGGVFPTGAVETDNARIPAH